MNSVKKLERLKKSTNNKSKVDILCSIHGIFKQSPDKHVNSKQGCPICSESKGEKNIRKKKYRNYTSEKI